MDDRAHHALDEPVDRGVVQLREGSVRPHAAGVRAPVAVEDALGILGGGHWDDRSAVAQDEQRALGPSQPLFDHQLAAGVAEPARQLGSGVRLRLLEGRGDEHPLAGREAVGLHDPGSREAAEEGLRLGERPAHAVAGRRHARRDQHLLHERLGALEPRPVGAGPDDPASERAQPVGEPGYERHLGPDHVEVRLHLLRRCRRRRDRAAPEARGHPGIARRHHHVRRPGEREAERVLPPPGADDADARAGHAAAKDTICSLPGPTPTSRTGTPIWSARNST